MEIRDEKVIIAPDVPSMGVFMAPGDLPGAHDSTTPRGGLYSDSNGPGTQEKMESSHFDTFPNLDYILDDADKLLLDLLPLLPMSPGKLGALEECDNLPNCLTKSSSLSPGKLGALEDCNNLPNCLGKSSMSPGKLGALEDCNNLPNCLDKSSMSPGKLGALEECDNIPNCLDDFNCASLSAEEIEDIMGDYGTANCGTANCGTANCGTANCGTINYGFSDPAGMEVPRGAKTRSQAFHVIGAAAVLETDGIPAPFALPYEDLYKPSGTTLIQPTVPEGDISLWSDFCGTLVTEPEVIVMPEACGTQLTELKPATVSDEATRTLTNPSIPYGTQLTDSKLVTVLDETTSDIYNHSKLCGTQLKDFKPATVPDEATRTSTTQSDLCGTLEKDPKLTTSAKNITSHPCGTRLKDPKLATVPDDAPNTDLSPEDCPDNSLSPQRKRRRRKRATEGEEGEGRKVRLYERAPLSDALEERKRKDALRAKNCRDRQRHQLDSLRERLAEVEGERDSLAVEVAGRRNYEEALLTLLREHHGITATPFGELRHPTPPPQTSE